MPFHRTLSIEVKPAKNRICEIPGGKICIESPKVDSPSKRPEQALVDSDVIGLVGYKFCPRNQPTAYLKAPTGCPTG
jgi:hypothetical protein